MMAHPHDTRDMAEAAALLDRCRSLGIDLTPAAGGRLKIASASPVTDAALRAALLRLRMPIYGLLAAEHAQPVLRPGEAVPLTAFQCGLWSLQMRGDADPGTLHPAAVFAITGPLDPVRLGRAADRLVARHDALRLRIATGTDGVAMMRAEPAAGPVLTVETTAEVAAIARGRAMALAGRRFDLAAEPPLRLHLVTDGDRDHRLILVVHHLAADGWSIGVMLADLARGFACDADLPETAPSDPAPSDPAPSGPAPSFLAEAARLAATPLRVQARVRAEARAAACAGLPLLQPLIPDLPRGGPRAPARLTRRLDADLVAGLDRLAAGAGATRFMALEAAFRATIAGLTGETLLALATPAANRPAGTEAMVGCFANTVLLGHAIDPAAPATALIAAVRAATAAALSRADIAFDDLVDILEPPRLPGVPPLAQIFFALQNAPARLALAGTDIRVDQRPLPLARHDISLQFRSPDDGGPGLELDLDYDAALYRETRMTGLADALAARIRAWIADPAAPAAGPLPAAAPETLRCRRIEAALRDHAGVADAAIDPRSDGPVAFVVPRRRLPAARIARMLAGDWSGAVATVTAIPRRRDGRVDRDALALLPAVTPAAAERLAGQGVTARPVPAPAAQPARLHLADLIRDDDAAGVHLSPDWAPIGLDDVAGPEGDDAPPAILSGGPLDAVYPPEGWSPADLLAGVAADPARMILIGDDPVAERRIPAAALMDRARRIAQGLRAAGFEPGQTVMLAPRRPDDMLAALTAAMLAGLIAAPILPPRRFAGDDPATLRLAHVARLTGAAAGLVEERDLAGFTTAAGCPALDIDALADGPPLDGPGRRWGRDDVALMAFTSGSTGVPKGVPLTAGNLWATPHGFGPAFGFRAGEVCLNFTALDHVASLFGFCGSALRAGADLALVPVDVFLADPAALLARLAHWRVARSWAPDFAWGLLATVAEAAPAGSLDLSALTAVFSAGECGLDQTFARASRAFARHGATTAFHTSWGMSETTSLTTLSAAWDGRGAHAVRAGVLDNGGPVPGTQARVVDAAGRPLPEGRIGRFEMRGPSVFGGYVTLGTPEIVHDADGWMATGDLAVIDRGRIVICGREKEIMILNGQNLSQVEIEDRLNGLPGVLAAHTALTASRDRRSGREVVAVFFAPDPADMPWPQVLQVAGAIRAELAARYGAAPDHVLPLAAARVPKTGLGKLQRTILRRRFEAGEFDPLIRRMDLSGAGPRSLPAWFFRETVAPRPADAPAGPAAGRIALLDQDVPLAHALRAAGADVMAGPPDDGAVPWTLVARQDAQTGDADAEVGLAPLVALVARLAAGRLHPARLVLLGTGDAVAQAALAALAETVAVECEGIAARVIDARGHGPADLAERILGSGPVERLVPVDPARAAPAMTGPRIGACGTPPLLVVAGGLGRVGRAVLPHLLAWTNWRFAILGRRPADAAAAALARLDGGDRIAYAAADVSDPVALDAALDRLQAAAGTRPFGVLHLAGEVTATPLADTTAAALLAPATRRLAAGEALAAAMLARGGGVLVQADSVLGRFASRDYAGYGIASAMARAAAMADDRPGLRRVSLGFSRWRDPDGLADPLGAWLAERGFAEIDGRRGAAVILAALTRDLPHLLVGLDPAAPEVAARAATRPAPLEVIGLDGPETAVTAALDRARSLGLPARRLDGGTGRSFGSGSARLAAIERAIAGHWRAVLGPDAPDDPDRSFFEAGGSSILAAQFHDRLVRDLGVGFDVVEIFGHPTQRALAALIAGAGTADTAPATDQAADTAGRRRAAAARNRRRSAGTGGTEAEAEPVPAGTAVERQP